MQRLVDLKAPTSPEEARLRELVRASEPDKVSAALKRQIHAAVKAEPPPRHGEGFALLRPAVVFGVLLVAGAATAAVTLGRRWIDQRSVPVLRPLPTMAPAEPAPRPPETPRAEMKIVRAPVELPAPEPETPRQRRGRAHLRSEDPSQVLQAVEALRNEHDPDRAAKLLDTYLASQPRGALVEEALALSIEAAVARNDPAAASFAKRYLKEYPKGRFRQTAETALARH